MTAGIMELFIRI